MHSFSIFLSLFFLPFAKPDDSENSLRAGLLQNYSRNSRPVLNFSSSVNAVVGAELYQLVGFDVKAETITTLLWQRIFWVDEHLRWDPNEFEGIENLRFSETEIWVPDILPYNEIGAFEVSKYRFIIPLKVDFNGNVQWMRPATMTTTCTMDVTDFPFDSQRCLITMGPWQHSADEVDVRCDQAVMDTGAFSPHTQWQLGATSCTRVESVYSSGRYSEVRFSMEFNRLNEFYVRNLLLPNAGLLALTGIIFFLPVESGERVGFGITLTLSLCVNLIIVTEYVPETSKTIPNVCNYFLASILLSGVSILLATISINLHIWTNRRKMKAESHKRPPTPVQNQESLESRPEADKNELELSVTCESTVSLERILSRIDEVHKEKSHAEDEHCSWSPMVKVDTVVGFLYLLGTNLYSLFFIFSMND